MALERRLARIEAARAARPDPEADAAFASLADTLDRLADRRAAGDGTAQAELDAFAAMARHGRA